jgi:hypothetical protein
MTPFIPRVQAMAEGAAPPTGPALVATMPRSVAQGRDRHVAVRALAKQLMAEANAVLGPSAVGPADGRGPCTSPSGAAGL